MIHKAKKQRIISANQSNISPMVLRYKNHVRKNIVITALIIIIGIMFLLILW